MDAIPLVPDRLSYSEMAFDTFKYPGVWTDSYEAYDFARPAVCNKIIQYMNHYEQFIPQVRKQTETLYEQFFSAKELVRQFS